MTVLVIAEHDHGTLKGATLNTVTAASAMRRRRACADRRPQRRWRSAGRGADRRRGQGAARRRRQPGRATRREHRRAGAGHRQELQPPAVPRHRAWQERRAARGRAARRGADQRRDEGHQRRHLRAPDLRRQRDRHGAEQRCDQGHHRAHDRLRSGSGNWRQRGDREDRCGGRQRHIVLRRLRNRQARPARTHRRQDHRQRWPRAGQQRQVQ